MKKIIFLALSLSICVPIFAQVKIGFIGAPQYDRQRWVSNNNIFSHTSAGRVQFQLGVIADLPVGDRWSIQPELLFSKHSTKHTTDFDLAIHSNLYNLGYLKMPVNIVYLQPFAKSHLYLGAGPYISNLVIHNYSFFQNDVNLGSGQLRVGKSQNDQITAWDIGARIKAGIQFKKGFMVGAFYDRGLKDINPQFVQTFNNTAGVNFAYFFNVSRSDKFNRYPDYYNY